VKKRLARDSLSLSGTLPGPESGGIATQTGRAHDGLRLAAG
jgi:chromate transport protein ChrA